MQGKLRTIFGLLVVGSSVVAFSGAANAFFIRPFLQLGSGGLIDGLVENGATFGQQNFTSALQSTVDLGDGTVKAFAEVTGPSGFAQAGGSFGERVTFDNTPGENVSFSFSFDGLFTSTAPVNTGLSAFVNANLFVHNPSTGADFSNFNTIGGELIGQTFFQAIPATAGSVFNFPISDMLAGSLTLGTAVGYTFDVFAALSVGFSTGANPVTATANFLNTGTFGINSNVNFASSSGVFLTGSTAPVTRVPEPATLGLFGIGLVGLGLMGWHRRRRDAAAGTQTRAVLA